jgi:ribonuclease PH
VEIQRLIGRSLRAVVDMKTLGERQIILDCDVLQADGGTRCASITGAFVALAIACDGLVKQKKIRVNPLAASVAAVSVGVVNNAPMLDLDYREDSRADVDANIVMTSAGSFVELQSTAEANPFSPKTLQQMIALGQKGVEELTEIQKQVLGDAYPK